MNSKIFPLIIISLAIASCNQPAKEKSNSTDSTAAKANSTSASKIEVNPLKNCYFGDLHLHTTLSPDANLFGCTLGPEDSYKFAMGEEVTYMGEKVKRIAPLDFLAVTDHSEYLSVIAAIRDPNGPYAGTELQKQWTSSDQKDVANSFGTFIKSTKENKPIPEL